MTSLLCCIFLLALSFAALADARLTVKGECSECPRHQVAFATIIQPDGSCETRCVDKLVVVILAGPFAIWAIRQWLSLLAAPRPRNS